MSAATAGTPTYPWKEIPGSSHVILLERVLARGSGLAVLDLGFGAGHFAQRIRPACRYLAGLELDPDAAAEGARFFDDAVTGDVFEGISGPWKEPFDVIVAGDVLEHLPRPEDLLAALKPLLKSGGTLLVSLPNVANVTVRAVAPRRPVPVRATAASSTARTCASTRAPRLARLLEGSGFRIGWQTATAMPVELALPALGSPPLAGLVRAGARLLAGAWPTLFGYQFVFEAAPA